MDSTYGTESPGIAVGFLIFNLIYNFAIVLILVAIISGTYVPLLANVRSHH